MSYIIRSMVSAVYLIVLLVPKQNDITSYGNPGIVYNRDKNLLQQLHFAFLIIIHE